MRANNLPDTASSLFALLEILEENKYCIWGEGLYGCLFFSSYLRIMLIIKIAFIIVALLCTEVTKETK